VDGQVLIVDDEEAFADACAEYLRAAGIRATAVGSAEEARLHLAAGPVSLVLLDVNLPGSSGFDLCRELRAASDCPIVFISARGGEDDEILALGIGGDDYLTKPFSLALLLAKVHRLLDRFASAGRGAAGPGGEGGFDDGRLRVDATSGRTFVDGAEIRLKPMEDRLLRHLVARRGRLVTKEELLTRVWGEPLTSEGTLTVHVRRLRLKIEPDPDHPTYVRTVWGRGYLFDRAD
jgi:two-component system response regulator RegX3